MSDLNLVIEMIRKLNAEIEDLREDRDKARRMYCSVMADCLTEYRSPQDIATDRGWDCYEEDKPCQ